MLFPLHDDGSHGYHVCHRQAAELIAEYRQSSDAVLTAARPMS
jgi:hypothetical protein